MDVVLIGCGLFWLTGLLYCLPVTSQNLSRFSYWGIVSSLWNMTSIVAVAAMLGSVIFLPPTHKNRRWSQNWLILLLACQAILALLPERQAVATIANILWPTWIGIAVVIALLRIESRTGKSDWLALADSLRKRPLKKRLKKGVVKLVATTALLIALVVVVGNGVYLTGYVRNQLASRSWPVAQAELIRCETVDGAQAYWNSDFHLQYAFDVQGTSYDGNAFEMMIDKPTAMSFNDAKEVVEQINSTEALQVAYNPANPSQNLIHPGLTNTFVMVTLVTVVQGLFFLVVLRWNWAYLAVSRFTDPDSVYRAFPSRYGRFDLTIGTSYACTLGFFSLAPHVPISTELFGALMLFIAVLGSHCWVARFTKAQLEEVAKQRQAGKMIVHGLNPA